MLHIEEKIQILDFNSNNEFYVNIEKTITKNDSEKDEQEEIKDDYYDSLCDKEIESVREKKKIMIYKNMQLVSENGNQNIKVTGKQKELCIQIFEEWLLKDRSFSFLSLEEQIYWESQTSIEVLKWLIKEVKKKLTKLWYKNIIDYWDEMLITRKQ